MTPRQGAVTKLKKLGFTLREIEILVGHPPSRKGAGARDDLKRGEGKKLRDGLYE